MKIIDLLNKIANGEEVPKYIKYYDRLHQKKDTMMCCYNNIIYKLDNNIIDLLDEVEIPEEEKQIPEKLKDILKVDDLIPPVDENMYKIWQQTIKNQNKINEICDYLKSKGE